MGIMCNMLVRAIFLGLVQGVNFRTGARREAQKLGVRGTARNLRDGTVEVYAEGSKDQVEALISVLRAREGVERVEVKIFDGFEIVF